MPPAPAVLVTVQNVSSSPSVFFLLLTPKHVCDFFPITQLFLSHRPPRLFFGAYSYRISTAPSALGSFPERIFSLRSCLPWCLTHPDNIASFKWGWPSSLTPVTWAACFSTSKLLLHHESSPLREKFLLFWDLERPAKSPSLISFFYQILRSLPCSLEDQAYNSFSSPSFLSITSYSPVHMDHPRNTLSHQCVTLKSHLGHFNGLWLLAEFSALFLSLMWISCKFLLHPYGFLWSNQRQLHPKERESEVS